LIGTIFGRFSAKKPNLAAKPTQKPGKERFSCPKCRKTTKSLLRLINHHRNEHEQREARIRRAMKEPMLQHEHLEKMGLA
jgi:hypothetical protein